MGLRFQRRIRLFPGVRLNVSKSGVSMSAGRRGLWWTFGKRGTRTTVGLPGTGLSYSSTSSPHKQEHEQQAAGSPSLSIPGWGVVVAIIATIVVVALMLHALTI